MSEAHQTIYQKWIILKEVEKKGQKRRLLCRCQCGTVRIIDRGNYIQNASTNCGCERRGKNVKNISGKIFGRLTVLSLSKRKGNDRRTYWICLCECGRKTQVSCTNLKGGKVRSCGCALGEGHITHGMTGSRPYRIWQGMIERCRNSSLDQYKNYGGRGIRVCERWRKSFAAFWKDVRSGYRDELSLDRFPNNNGNYEPGNVRWATTKMQSNNRRTNIIVAVKGQKMTLKEASDELKIPYITAFKLHKKGMLPEK